MAIVFLDIDGTILNHNTKEISIKTVQAIKQLKENGHIPIISTGRIPFLCQDIFNQLGIDSYVCANGNFVVFKGELLYSRYVEKELVNRVLEYSATNQIDIALEFEDKYLIHHNFHNDIVDFNKSLNLENIETDDSYVNDHNVLQFVMCPKGNQVDDLRKNFPELQFNISTKYGYDVNINGSMKDNGVKVIEQYLKLSKSEMFAFGDGYNDISIIKYVGTGIAMGNGNKYLKAAADFVTLDINYEAIYFTLKLYELI